jgi:linoleoyl-CoA desaturase
MKKYSFAKDTSSFFKVLKEQVDGYFNATQLHPAGNERLYWKSAVQVISGTALYIILVFSTPAPAISIMLCVLLGINLAVIGFNIMHEGGHQSFSRYAWLNNVAAYFLNVLGGNAYFWKVKHNINHHTYTNIEGMDSDIDVKPFMRLCEEQPLKKYHRYQHIYWFGLYAVSYLAWVFYEDFEKYFTRKVSLNSEKKNLNFKQHFIFWFSKVMYVIVYIVIPIICVGWLAWLIGFMIVTTVCGLTTSIVFQLAHVVEGTEFHSTENSQGRTKVEWAIHQIKTTANFATSSKCLHWLLGGLNFQIEHHLFPRISHVHYPVISRMVKEVCRDYDVVYNEYSSMLKAIASHISHLYRLGRLGRVA